MKLQKQLIKLPQKEGLSKDFQLSVTKKVNGNIGSSIVIKGNYLNAEGKLIKVYGALRIPSGAFDGEREITMTIDNQYAAVEFYPHMTFDKPLNLNLMFAGLDLSTLNLPNGSVGFYYVDDKGNLTPIANQGVLVNNFLGSLMVVGARIDHFSRYAFAK